MQHDANKDSTPYLVNYTTTAPRSHAVGTGALSRKRDDTDRTLLLRGRSRSRRARRTFSRTPTPASTGDDHVSQFVKHHSYRSLPPYRRSHSLLLSPSPTSDRVPGARIIWTIEKTPQRVVHAAREGIEHASPRLRHPFAARGSGRICVSCHACFEVNYTPCDRRQLVQRGRSGFFIQSRGNISGRQGSRSSISKRPDAASP